jgi:hypothetical protein
VQRERNADGQAGGSEQGVNHGLSVT